MHFNKTVEGSYLIAPVLIVLKTYPWVRVDGFT